MGKKWPKMAQNGQKMVKHGQKMAQKSLNHISLLSKRKKDNTEIDVVVHICSHFNA